MHFREGDLAPKHATDTTNTFHNVSQDAQMVRFFDRKVGKLFQSKLFTRSSLIVRFFPFGFVSASTTQPTMHGLGQARVCAWTADINIGLSHALDACQTVSTCTIGRHAATRTCHILIIHAGLHPCTLVTCMHIVETHYVITMWKTTVS